MFDIKLDWSKSFETGMEEIDTQHKELFRIGRDIEQLLRIQCIGVSDKQLLDIVCSIRDFTGYHFYAEEGMMKEMDYPGRDAHVAYHKACSDFIMKVDMPQLKADPVKGLKQIHDEVKSWITFHVIAEDLAMAKAYQEYKKKIADAKQEKADALEQQFGKLVTKLDVTKIYLYKNQKYKGHLVAVFNESASELTRLSALERNMFFADIAKAAKIMQKQFGADKVNYLDLEQMQGKLAFHIVPRYANEEGYDMLPAIDLTESQVDSEVFGQILEEIKKCF